MKIAENVFFYRGDVVRPNRAYRGMASSNVLVLAGEEQIIIDPGLHLGRHHSRIMKQMAEDGIRLMDTRHILVTHHHPDHINGAKDILRKGRCKLWVHEASEEYLHDPEYQFRAFINFPLPVRKEIYALPMPALQLFATYLGYRFDYFRADHLYRGGQTLSLNGFKIDVIETFGHCRGQVAFWLPEQRVMMSGDIFTMHQHFGPSVNNPGSHFGTALRDLEMLAGYEIEALVPGHDDIIQGRERISAVLDSLLAETNKLTGRIFGLLSGKRLHLKELMSELYDTRNLGLEFNNSAIVYNMLKHFQSERKVSSQLIGNKVYWSAVNRNAGLYPAE